MQVLHHTLLECLDYMLVIFLLLQIVFESLPVSSSGHAALFSLRVPGSVDFFAHFFAWGIFVAYLFLQREEIRTWWQIAGRFAWRSYLGALFLVWAGTALVLVGKLFFMRSVIPQGWLLAFGFLLSGSALLSLRLLQLSRSDHVSLAKTSIGLLVAQSLALILPGVSRMGLVFVAARWLGWSSKAAWYWMIATAFPLFAGAGLLGLFAGGVHLITVLGGVQAWLVVVLAWTLSWFLFLGAAYLARSERFWVFGYYMIALALLAAGGKVLGF